MIQIEPLGEALILANIEVISSTIEAVNEISTTDTAAMMEYMATITSIQATASETQASIKYWLLNEQGKVLDKMLKSQLDGVELKQGGNAKLVLPPTTAKMFAHTRCKEWEYLYEKIERLSRNVSHSIDSVRTMLSFAKSEITNSHYQK